MSWLSWLVGRLVELVELFELVELVELVELIVLGSYRVDEVDREGVFEWVRCFQFVLWG